ncbi:hypothetical protein Tco_0126452 [Tanacetum coccineum]
MSKLLYTRFTKLIINHLLSNNKSIPRRSSSKLHNSQDDQPITKLSNTIRGDYKFGMEILNTMISNAIKKLARYKFYMAKKVESKNPKIVVKPEVQHVSTVKSGRGKGFICYCDQVANVPNKLKIDNVSRKTRSQTITEEIVMGELANSIRSKASTLESLKQNKQAIVGEGSSAAHDKYYDSSDTNSDATLYSLSSKKSRNETDDADNSDIDLSDDNPSNFIQTLLDETPANELIDFISHPVYTDPQTTSVVHNLEGKPELTSYISGASKVPLGTHVDVLATKTLLQEMFLDENAHHIPSLPAKKMPYPTITPQPSSLQAKAKKLMQKAKKNMRKINFKKADSLNNHKEENKKKWRKDVGEPSSRSSSFDLLIKSDIDQNENHILGPSTMAIAKKLKSIIQKDELTIVDLEGTGLERLKQQYQNDVELEYHVSQLKAAMLIEAKWNSDEDDASKPRLFE